MNEDIKPTGDDKKGSIVDGLVRGYVLGALAFSVFYIIWSIF